MYKPRKLKGGVIDIETFPGTYRTFANNMYETSLMKEVEPVKLASYSYLELGKKRPITKGVWQFKNYGDFVKSMHKIFVENDFLVGHNAKKFDLKQSNTFFAAHGLPNTEVKIIDTLTEIKRNFRLPSYKLKYCLAFFGIGYKIETGGDELWFETEAGNKKAQKNFLKYNENDTVQTAKLFKFLNDGGWINFPTWSRVYVPGEGCWRCGVEDTQKRGPKPRKEGWIQEYMCKNCGQRLYTTVIKDYDYKTYGSTALH